MIKHSHLVIARGIQNDLKDIDPIARVVAAVEILKDYTTRNKLDLVELYRQVSKEKTLLELGYE